MTAQVFTAQELDRPGRHEFVRGEVIQVFGVKGARREHVNVMGKYWRGAEPALAWHGPNERSIG